jgi:acetyltransferase-like isoleucine patch superfamily enzyme
MPARIAKTAVVEPTVSLGDRSVVGDYVVLGMGRPDSPLETLEIGTDAVIRSHTVIYHGSRIGDRFQTGHGAMIRESNEIGSDVSVGTHSIVEHHVVLGDRVRIHSNAFIPEFSILEEGAWIGPSVTFTNATYPLSPSAKAELRGPRIMRGAKIGANATILPGITVGRDALVGAGAVVVDDVPDGVVVVGNPARPVRMVADIPEYGGVDGRADR